MIEQCKKCSTKYESRKSSASLRLTWCSVTCEIADLGYHLLSLEKGKFDKMRTIQYEDTYIQTKVVTPLPVDNDDWEEYELCPA